MHRCRKLLRSSLCGCSSAMALCLRNTRCKACVHRYRRVLEVRFSVYSDEILVHSFCYEHVGVGCLGLAISTEDMRVLMRGETTPAREKLRLSRISYGAALHALLDEFGFSSSRWIPAFSYLRNSTFLYRSLLRENSPKLAKRPRGHHLSTPLLSCCSMGNVTSCHQESRGCVYCQKASAGVE